MSLHLITTCVRSKMQDGPSIEETKRLLKKEGRRIDIVGLYGAWRKSLQEQAKKTDLIVASTLYSSRLWRLFRLIYDTAVLQMSTERWVISAGLGFFNAKERICGYRASFTASQDSVYDGQTFAQETNLTEADIHRTWWNLLIANPPLERDHSAINSINELFHSLIENDAVLLVGSSAYLSAIRDDLSLVKAAGYRVAIVGVRKDTTEIPEQLRPFVKGYGNYQRYRKKLAEQHSDLLRRLDPSDADLVRDPKELTHGLAAYHLLLHFLDSGDWDLEFE